jgi:predicted SAM-dependent methyltransferase
LLPLGIEVRRAPVVGDLGYHRYRAACQYLRGEGIEVGALTNPLPLPPGARVRYVDRMSKSDLIRHYPDLDIGRLVDVARVDDGERLATFATGSQDFVIANHFLEHCQDPLGALYNFLRVLKPGGIAYIAVPDKRYTFDRDRPVTSLEHVLRDHEHGPAASRRQHFEEWVRLVHKVHTAEEAAWQVDALMAQDYSIHYHVWTQAEFIELLLALRRGSPFEIELVLKLGHEMLAILRKVDAASRAA